MRAPVVVRHSLRRLSIPFRTPFATANGVVAARDLLLLRLEDEDGYAGHGEAAPFEPYDGVPIEQAAAALAAWEPGMEPPELPQARAAVEMATLDLAARRAGRPLGEPGAEAIAVNYTVPAGPPEEAAAAAIEGVRAGFSAFKVKVGLPDDPDRLAAVRAAIGSWPAVRIDANGAWSADEAIYRIGELARHDLEFVEQPCATLEELAAVRRAVPVPIVADEPIASPRDVDEAAHVGACDGVNVKLAACGGFAGARATLRAAAGRGMVGYLSSTFDGPWGIAAALQLAATERVQIACGLATLGLFDARLARTLAPPRSGLLAVPQGPGLGVAADAAALAEVLAEELV